MVLTKSNEGPIGLTSKNTGKEIPIWGQLKF